MFTRFTTMLIISLVASMATYSQDGNVELPLELYNQMIATQQQLQLKRPAPTAYAFSQGQATVSISHSESGPTARVQFTFKVQILEDGWVLVPLLHHPASIERVTVDGREIEVVKTARDWSWGIDKQGTYQLQLSYTVTMQRVDGIGSGTIPIPAVPATQLQLNLEQSNQQVTILPVTTYTHQPTGTATSVTASIPTTQAVQVAWQGPTRLGLTLSEARYQAQQQGEQVNVRAQINLQSSSKQPVELPLIPAQTTLHRVQLDGNPAQIIVREQKFWVVVKTPGAHKLDLQFEVPIQQNQSLPWIDMPLVLVPISQITLSLSGRKDVAVEPAGGLSSTFTDTLTEASMFAPMTDHLRFSWAEAVPENLTQEFRANSQLVQLVHGDEGVLLIEAWLDLSVTRGETHVVDLFVPLGTQINDVQSATGDVSEWTTSDVDSVPGQNLVRIFLNRRVDDQTRIRLLCETPLVGDADIEVPMIRVDGMNRQAGMIALLASKTHVMNPVSHEHLTQVGENQIPADLRSGIQMVVAHTFKYAQSTPKLTVKPSEPERLKGKFDIVADTLISLGDVSVHGSAILDCHVKSGQVDQMTVQLPAHVSLLHVAAPSMRTHQTELTDGVLQIQIYFTQQLEGQFRVELDYESIIEIQESKLEIPLPLVVGAEVQQGRIGVEAVSAVEIAPYQVDHLTLLDWNELPQSLVMKTTHPILTAYKYVRVDPPVRLGVEIKRHTQVDVQAAAIDLAQCTTLVTREGTAVHRVRFSMRNSGQQFLRLKMAPEAEIWSAFVAGKAVKPAIVEADTKTDREALINVIHSADPFEVTVVMATSCARLHGFGSLQTTLPVPDITVTQTQWDVYLPVGPNYRRIKTNMDPATEPQAASNDDMRAAFAAEYAQPVGALQIDIPRSGIRYQFQKIYANRALDDPYIEVVYLSETSRKAGVWLSLLAIVVLGWGARRALEQRSLRSLASWAILPLMYLTGASVGYGVSLRWSLALGLLLTFAALAWHFRGYLSKTTQISD